MVLFSELKEGLTVKVKPNFGWAPAVLGVVLGVHRNINNGRSGIDYSSGGGVYWAYLDQVVEVLQES